MKHTLNSSRGRTARAMVRFGANIPDVLVAIEAVALV